MATVQSMPMMAQRQDSDRKLDALEDVIEAAWQTGSHCLLVQQHDLERILQRFPAEKLDSSDSSRDGMTEKYSCRDPPRPSRAWT
jgi:hypothetical protein